jgi:hypothetical protein
VSVGGSRLLGFVTHLSLAGNYYNGVRIQKVQCQELRDFVLSYPAATPKVLMGDFNFDPEKGWPEHNESNAVFIDAGFTDAYRQVFPSVTTYPGKTHPVSAPAKRYDHVFYLRTSSFVCTASAVATSAGTVSDHFPVTASMSWSVANLPPVARAGADQTIADGDGNGSQAVTLNGSASSDGDGTIVSHVWRKGTTQIATGASPSVVLAVGSHTITLTVTDNAGATSSDTVVITVTAAATVPIRINFQPPGHAGVTGWLADSGAVFAARGNGYSYGWNIQNDDSRDRNAATSPDELHDTLIYMQKYAPHTWELAVPNGSYEVTLLLGDPSYSVFNSIILEGVTHLDSDGANRFDTRTFTVTVSDGRLTLAPVLPTSTHASNPELCCIEVLKLPTSGG